MTAAPVARLRTPGEVVATVPWLVGFHPSESLVVVALHEPRGRVGLTMRFDLPPPAGEAALADEVVARVRHEEASRALLVVYVDGVDGTDGTGGAAGSLDRESLVQRVRDGLVAHDVAVPEALLVRGGRWWSYACDGPCCPAAGTPVEVAAASAAVGSVAAQTVLSGRAVVASRRALAASIAVPGPREALRVACAVAERARAREVAVSPAAARSAALVAWRAALDRFADPSAQLDDEEAARLAVSLDDRPLRDEVAVEALLRPEALLVLLRSVARRTPAPYDAPVCALLAWVAYGRGDGGLANVALDRALASDPQHSLAVLLADALHRQVPPSLLRDVLVATREELRRRSA